MTKRLSATTILCLAACSQYELKPYDPNAEGDGDDLFPKIEVTPSSLLFALDDVEPADGLPDGFDIIGGQAPMQQTVTVKNIGDDTLHILDLYTAEGEPSYDVTNISSLVLSVGATATFDVIFKPEQPFEHPETVLIDSDDPERPTATVDVNGLGVAPAIEVDPVTVDFGFVDIGCDTVQNVDIRNVGNADLVLASAPNFAPSNYDDMELWMGPDYENDPTNVHVFPLTIAPGEFITVQVLYHPINDVDDQAVLTVGSNDPYQPVVYAEQEGGINGAEEQIDLFDQPAQPMTDIVFIVDNSGSMYEEQTNLANNFETMMWELDQTDADYQIAVITTDTSSFQGEVINNATLNAVDKFVEQAVAGTGGSGTERGLQMLYQCVTPGGDCSEAAGFMRDDALFAGIVVSDEPDQSSLSPNAYIEYLWTLKDDPDLIRLHAIAGAVPNPTCGTCSSPGWGYDEAVEYSGGSFLDVCASDWGEHMSVLAAGSVADLSQFKLSQDPVESTIEVFVDDGQVENGWWYTGHEEDEGSNAVKFQDEYIPEGGSEIRIEYVVRGDCEQ